MQQFVERAAHVADILAAAKPRRTFLTAVADFERMLTMTLEYPRTCFSREDFEALRAIADTVVERIETRVGAHGDRPAVERNLVAAIYRIRLDIENMYSRIDAPAAGNPSRNGDRSALVSPSR